MALVKLKAKRTFHITLSLEQGEEIGLPKEKVLRYANLLEPVNSQDRKPNKKESKGINK
jgi:hypothetical protein